MPRVPVPAVGLAPLTSMYFGGENERRRTDDFRPELHDSDGLLMHSAPASGSGVPCAIRHGVTVSSFMDKDPRGFGLLQRDRAFASYQDLEAEYHQRPGYWVEPIGPWGEGQVDLVEIPTTDETSDNIVAYWHPARPVEPGQETVVSYRLRALSSVTGMHPGAG